MMYKIVFAVKKHLNYIRIVNHKRVWTCFEISWHQMWGLCTYIIHHGLDKGFKFTYLKCVNMHLHYPPTVPSRYKDTKNRIKVHLKHCLTSVNFGYIQTRNTKTLRRKQFCNILLIEKHLTKYFNFLNLKICVMFYDKNRIFLLIFKPKCYTI